MTQQIFVNLPVKDLNKSIEFFTKLGYTFNQQFTDEKATCMIIGDNIFAMLLVEPFFQTFTDKEIADGKKVAEVFLALSAESRAAVDERIEKVKQAGGKVLDKIEDHGWMYGRSYEDLDGHQWEILYMDPNGPSEG